MLVAALLDGTRTVALYAGNGPFMCPHCEQRVILKRGRIKIAHFAHKPPTDCRWATGETLAHLTAKQVFYDSFKVRGGNVDMELPFELLEGDRRADVVLQGPDCPVVFELQHSSISLDALERRVNAYAYAGIAQMWIPFFRSGILAKGKRIGNTVVIERYPARPFERWVHTFHFGKLWFYNPSDRKLWVGHFDKAYITKEDGYGWDGEFYPGGEYISKRWRKLTLRGPYELGSLWVTVKNRQEWHTPYYDVPACLVATFAIGA